MSAAIITALIAAFVSLMVGLVAAIVTVNLNRATAVKYLTEAAEKTGIENKRLNDKLEEARTSIIILVRAIEKTIPLLPTDEPHRCELRELCDKARVEMH